MLNETVFNIMSSILHRFGSFARLWRRAAEQSPGLLKNLNQFLISLNARLYKIILSSCNLFGCAGQILIYFGQNLGNSSNIGSVCSTNYWDLFNLNKHSYMSLLL